MNLSNLACRDARHLCSCCRGCNKDVLPRNLRILAGACDSNHIIPHYAHPDAVSFQRDRERKGVPEQSSHPDFWEAAVRSFLNRYIFAVSVLSGLALFFHVISGRTGERCSDMCAVAHCSCPRWQRLLCRWPLSTVSPLTSAGASLAFYHLAALPRMWTQSS